jgi:hypothetical protein
VKDEGIILIEAGCCKAKMTISEKFAKGIGGRRNQLNIQKLLCAK